MNKHLTAIGNSLGIIIEKPILDLLNIDRDTQLDMRTDGEALIIRPIKGSKKERALNSARRMMKIHEGSLKKLAE